MIPPITPDVPTRAELEFEKLHLKFFCLREDIRREMGEQELHMKSTDGDMGREEEQETCLPSLHTRQHPKIPFC